MTVGCRSADELRWASATAAVRASARIAGTIGARRISIEFVDGRGLCEADAAGRNRRFRVVLAADGGAGQPSQHRQLPCVRQGVGNWSLEQTFGRPAKRVI